MRLPERMRPEGCISDLRLDGFFAGELAPEARGELEAHPISCARCRARGGSAATFRLLVVDACRAGAVTRRKGGHIVSGGPLAVEDTLPGSGLALLAATAPHEDAQESDEIGGSFFNHALVSGLMGSADANGDGAVSLGEAYDHAYGATLRATSRTAHGTQHPTFRYDFAGQGALILTRPQQFASTRAVLHFPSGIHFLVLRGGRGGDVIGEVGANDRRRSLSVRPGRYFVRGRGADVLLENEYELAEGTSRQIDPDAMKRIEYAQLVRKGGRSSGLAYGIRVGPTLRTALGNAGPLDAQLRTAAIEAR